MAKKIFIDACLQKDTERIPVWIMRQAGRYLKSYQKMREKYNFSTMYKNPDLAAKVTLFPFEVMDLDAAILFSDILVLPEAMGMELKFHEGKGPAFTDPIRTQKQIRSLRSISVEQSLHFVAEAIDHVKKELSPEISLIGFCGGPWTLAAYMVEGGNPGNFDHIKSLRYEYPDLLNQLLTKISDLLIDYCHLQIKAGVDAIQIFDTWAGILDENGFLWYTLPHIQRVIGSLKTEGVPIIYFGRNVSQWFQYLRNCGANTLGVDWSISLAEARKLVGDKVALQGNLDPHALYAPIPEIKKMVKEMISSAYSNDNQNGYIANLGHGIFPDTPLEHVQSFVEMVHSCR